jgi:MFS transporter, DHA2 family, multidrug resistance protein
LSATDATLSMAPSAAPGSTRIRLDQLLIVIAVMLAVLLEIIDTSIVNVALPAIMGNLGATLDEAEWVIIGYIVSNVVIIPMTGWLAARFGRKRYFVTSILIFTVASLLCGVAQSIGALVFWRIVQGLGGGALLSTAQAILVETFPASRQGMGQAIFGIGAMIGPSLGPTLGGWLTDQYSWHWIFFINVPLGVGAAALCAAKLRDPLHRSIERTSRVDWIGVALLIVGIGALQVMLERGHKEDWFQSTQILVLTFLAAGALGTFVWHELHCEYPIVDLRVLRRRPLLLGCLLGTVLGMGLYGSIFLFPIYAQSLLGWSAWDSGMAILPSSLATACVMAFVGRLVWTLGPRLPFVCGMILTCGALYWMRSWTLASGWDQVLGPQVLRGIALGAMFVPLSTATLRALPPEEVAQGAGLYNLFRQLGGSLGIALLTTLLDQRTAIHRAVLVERTGPLDPIAGPRMQEIAHGLMMRNVDPATAQQTAAAFMERMVHAQSSMLAFQDLYLMLAIVFALAIPLGLAVARNAPGRTGPAVDTH